jgi:hypothetical protein
MYILVVPLFTVFMLCDTHHLMQIVVSHKIFIRRGAVDFGHFHDVNSTAHWNARRSPSLLAEGPLEFLGSDKALK